ncbi:MAG: hypothetical protein ABI600_15930 [Luteolibacter sp.]
MIPVPNPITEPSTFVTQCKKRGEDWLVANPNAKTSKYPGYWTEFQSDLEDGFSSRCGWLATKITFGQVDHYLSKKHHSDQTYTWSNYRYIAGSLNGSKGTHDAAILDPFDVQPGWFEVILPSCQLKLTSAIPAAFLTRAEFTLKQLKLVRGQKVRKLRKRYYDEYKSGMLTKIGLREYAPLIADAVDQWEASGCPLP